MSRIGAEVGLSAQATLLDEDPAAPQKGAQQPPNFRPMSTVAKQLPISATAELLLHDRPTAVVGAQHLLYPMQAFVQLRFLGDRL